MKHLDQNGWKSRPERRLVNLRGFALGAGVDADIVVTDLSYDGCKIRSTHPLRAGAMTELRITRQGAVTAEVRWSAGTHAGLRFVQQ